MPLSVTASRSYRGEAEEAPEWSSIEAIFDALCGPDARSLPKYPNSLDTIDADWTDANGVVHRAETLKEVEEAYRGFKTFSVRFAAHLSDGTQAFFLYWPGTVRAEVRVSGRPDEVEGMVKLVEEAFPGLRSFSWSGERAKAVAEALRAVLRPRMPRGGEIFLSTRMAPGSNR